MGDRVAVLDRGVLQQVDTPQRIHDRPANAFVAGFIGSPAMNLMEMPLTADGVAFGSTTVRVPLDQRPDTDAVTVGIRPEDVTLAGEGLAVVVTGVEQVGDDIHVHAQPEGAAPGASPIVARIPADGGPGVGERVHLLADPERVHVFHPSTGRRL